MTKTVNGHQVTRFRCVETNDSMFRVTGPSGTYTFENYGDAFAWASTR